MILMVQQQPIIDAVYFLHLSFLEEVANKWYNEGYTVEAPAKLFFGMAQATKGLERRMITCDRTYLECKKTKYSLVAIPAVYLLLDYRALPQDDEDSDTEDNDIYSLKVAALNQITDKSAFFVVSDAVKTAIQAKAAQKGYTNKILSTSDFVL